MGRAADGGASMSKHTPAPWNIDDDEDGTTIYSGFQQVAMIEDLHGIRSKTYSAADVEMNANARLIAAAPRLLAAAKAALNAHRQGASDDSLTWPETLAAVIAQAEAES